MRDTGHMPPSNPCKPQMVMDFDLGEGQPTRLYFSTPHAVELAWCAHEVLPALQRIEHATRQGAWAAGYLAYEAAAGLDPKMAEAMDIAPNTKHAMPLLAFALFDAPDPDPVFANGLAGTHPCAAPSKPAGEIGLQWHVNETSDNYAKKIAAVRHAIAAGDAYQVNYTLRAQTQAGDGFSPWHYYESLQRRQQCRYGAYLDFGSHQVLSLSPELFFDWDRTDGRITTRPMKGTARRGTTPELDAALALQLQTSAKERTENVMIVDLLRNDLGRIATTGSVHVQQLLQTEAVAALARQLALQSQLIARDGDLWHLRVDSSSLNQTGSRDRLRAALEAAGHARQLHVELGPVTDTPARRLAFEKKTHQLLAEDIVKSNLLVQTLRRDFGAKIVPGSIKPLSIQPE